jgi:transposase-like protein
MKANLSKIKKRRRYSEEFQRKIVKDFEKGIFTVLELSRLYHVHFQSIYNWIYKYSTQNEKSIEIVEMKESSTQKLKDLESRIKDLERAVGKKQLYIDYMEKMMEIAKEDLGVDIKKNYSTPQSIGSEKTGIK